MLLCSPRVSCAAIQPAAKNTRFWALCCEGRQENKKTGVLSTSPSIVNHQIQNCKSRISNPLSSAKPM